MEVGKWKHRTRVTVFRVIIVLVALQHYLSASEDIAFATATTTTTTTTSCVDDQSFRWRGDLALNCASFLRTNKEQLCDRKQKGILIRDICRATCESCGSLDRDRRNARNDIIELSGHDPSIRGLVREEGPELTIARKRTAKQETDSLSCQDATGKFFIDGVNGKKNCEWVRNRIESNKKDRCDKPTGIDGQGKPVFERCPETCSQVGLGPCAPTVCQDATGKFFIEGVASGKKNCEWVQNRIEANKKDRCDKPTGIDGQGKPVFERCPGTCATVGLGPCAPSALFREISDKLAEYANDEVAHPWVYKPWVHWHGPMTFDVNGDGFPDLLSHHHVGLAFEGGPGIYWDFATSVVNTNHEISYEAATVDVQYNATIPDPYVPEYQDIFPECIDESNLVDGSPIEDFVCVNYTDFHGSIVLDFDRDGKLDVLNAIGGSNGAGSSIVVESMLFWGVDGSSSDATDSTRNLRFSGGRGALLEAGLSSGEPQRTYGVYAADFNNDGYLDIFYLNKYRKEDLRAPGMVYMSRGVSEPRHFDAHDEVSEFSLAALLTDFDQDGYANEFLILQQGCNIEGIEGIDIENCNPEPRAVVYKWDSLIDSFVPIWTSAPFEAKTKLISLASGDFNGDGLTDIVVLVKLPTNKGQLRFWYSSEESKLLGNSTIIVDIPSDCKPRHSIRAADFDLDGTLDLFVLCYKRSHVIFQQSPSDETEWSPMIDAVLGPLGDPEQSKAETIAFIDRCFEGDNLDQCELTPTELANYEKDDGVDKRASSDPIGQGVTVFDYNNDGFLDLFLAYRFGYNVFFENTGVPGNKFVSLMLKGTTGNTDGIGAIVLLTWNNGVDADDKVQLREHNAQTFESDAFGSRESRIVFGIGATGVPLRLDVRWPSGKVSTLTKEMLEAAPMTMNYNEILTITEPE